jgi:hypothetical protein
VTLDKVPKSLIAAAAFLAAASTFAVFALFFGERGDVLRIVYAALIILACQTTSYLLGSGSDAYKKPLREGLGWGAVSGFIGVFIF